MKRNSLKFFIRNLKQQKTVGILSIGCLGISIAVALLIGLWGMNELNFYNLHHEGDRIYRLTIHTFKNN